MKNYWLERLRIGKRVRYKGLDPQLNGKIGYVVKLDDDWVLVQFEFPGKVASVKNITVEKDNLEII